ncbi:hypothetical protein GWI33_015918 [Rhynchophorus ferrugineus]|uniref:Uncharacterized protein n=1 Tax=Rhynchophorus ferrugineus TaxID=354439 RepID=A0A834M3Z0_RHYFE|nr:hypothetical protein GWI33_015918 [Rhynchophorus ferrugineus]
MFVFNPQFSVHAIYIYRKTWIASQGIRSGSKQIVNGRSPVFRPDTALFVLALAPLFCSLDRHRRKTGPRGCIIDNQGTKINASLQEGLARKQKLKTDVPETKKPRDSLLEWLI